MLVSSKGRASLEGVATMKKGYVVAGVAVLGLVTLMRRGAGHCGGMDFGKMIERMPDDAPPKWMYRNISAIRENTDRILELLEPEHEAVSN